MEKKKIVCIVGPTGVGKTKISIELAKMFNGEIISADSMQIYKNMDIGTAKITKGEMQGINHHLIDIIEPTENFSVAEWKNLAEEKIKDILRRGKTPFVVGGTCLYVNALINNYQFYNTERNEDYRSKYEEMLKTDGEQSLYLMLCERDPEFAKTVDPKKTRAIIRYLEILDMNKQADLKIQDQRNDDYEFILIGLYNERAKLYENIDARVDKMLELGLENEVKMLVERNGLTPAMQSANAIGYREFWPYLAGDHTYKQLVMYIKQHSRNYAKRQLTFMRKMKNLEWYLPEELSKITTRVYSFLKG